MSAVELLDPSGSDEDQRELVQIVRRGYEGLGGFIRKGLEYFEWRAQPHAKPEAKADLSQVLTEAVDSFEILRDDATDFHFEVTGDPFEVRGDGDHLRRVFKILIDNAVRFSTEDKRIRIELIYEMGWACVTVRDRGIGFPPEFAREMFRPFTIGDVKHHSRGSGVSLALAAEIIHRYGGEVQAWSQGIDQGATFTVALPTGLDEREEDGPERRRSRRRTVEKPFTFLWELPRGELVPLAIVDLSVDGIGLRLERSPQMPDIQEDEAIDVRFIMNEHIFIPLRIRVVRIRTQGTTEDWGAMFENRGSSAYRAFVAFIRFLDIDGDGLIAEPNKDEKNEA